MGDCRIRVVIAKSLFVSLPEDLIANHDVEDSSVRVASNNTSVSFVRMYSADTTIREVVNENCLLRELYFRDIFSSQSTSNDTDAKIQVKSQFILWDCTFSPPRDVTSWPVQDFPNLQGLKSKTLHDAGLFPSGTWMAIPKGAAPRNFTAYDSNAHVDIQFNNGNHKNNANIGTIDKMNTSRRVEFNDSNLRPNVRGRTERNQPRPSQVMETVSNRFAAEEREEELKRMETSETSVDALRRVNKQRRAQKELERATKLERRIAMLEEQSQKTQLSKKKKVSDQVLRMLVKSRATGDKNLKEQDRLYFQCLILTDNTDNQSDDQCTTETASDDSKTFKECRYFSPQDTFAKIANSFLNGRGGKENGKSFSEVLCTQHSGQIRGHTVLLPYYRRFPVTMRVYEAKSQGYLSLSENTTNFFNDTLIIRWYKYPEEATPLIQHEITLDTINMIGSTDEETSNDNEQMADAACSSVSISFPALKKINTAICDAEAKTVDDSQLSDAIREMDIANKNVTKKGASAKKSAAALKVRQMKMKSKAKGNKKLQIEDRLFLEVVTIPEIHNKPSCEYYFLSRKDPIERILQYVGTGASASSPLAKNNAEEWELLVPIEGSSYRLITKPSIPMEEAGERNILKSFDRVILRPKSN